MKKAFVGGNWKMNKTTPEAMELARSLKNAFLGITDTDIAIFPPFTVISSLSEILRNSNITLGGQNMHFAEQGAFTGEVSSKMLLTAGAKMVILGHSERRHIFGEDDEFINKKIKRALEDGLTPLLCIGEVIEEREANRTEDILRKQITGSLEGINISSPDAVMIAYEPVWAIGTGLTATPRQAEEAQLFVRKLLAERYGEEMASDMRILYGGSVKPQNAFELMSQPNVDGVFVGGASLTVASFAKIVDETRRAVRQK